MTDLEQKAILSIAMMAALADGNRAEQERDAIEKLAASFAGTNLNVDEIYHDVLLRKISLPEAASRLQSAESKEAAYELAVGAKIAMDSPIVVARPPMAWRSVSENGCLGSGPENTLRPVLSTRLTCTCRLQPAESANGFAMKLVPRPCRRATAFTARFSRTA